MRIDNALKVRFSATPGEEPEMEVALVWRLRVRALLTDLCAGGELSEVRFRQR